MMAEIPKESNRTEYPFFLKATIMLFGIILFGFLLRLLSSVLIPFAFGGLLAILLNPLSIRLERKLPRGIAIFCTELIALLVVAGLIYFLSRQIFAFSTTMPALKAKSEVIIVQVEQWASSTFGIAVNKQTEMINKVLNGSESYVGQTVSSILASVTVTLLVPFYIYFILYFKPLILNFLFQIFSEKHSLRVAEVLAETNRAIQSYVVGLLIEMVIVSSMNSVALLALGIRSAILIGVIGGIVNVIPYLGGIVATALPILMATVTKEGYSTQLAILVSYMIIQMIDNNVLVPKIVSSKVKINALFSILVVLCGGVIWGYSGMFLSIPFVAIIKIIFDRIESMRPWGQLLGTKIPEIHAGVKWQAKWQRIFMRKKMQALSTEAEQKADLTDKVS